MLYKIHKIKKRGFMFQKKYANFSNLLEYRLLWEFVKFLFFFPFYYEFFCKMFFFVFIYHLTLLINILLFEEKNPT